MSLLRIYCPLPNPPQRCHWALIGPGTDAVTGESSLEQLSLQVLQRAQGVQLVIPASQVLITRAQLPPSANRRTGSLLAYAIEEGMVSDPETNLVSWLGSADGADVLAVVDRKGVENWRVALAAAGIHDYSVCCETLLLPLSEGGWSFAWNGREGFVRTGKFEGAATDSGDRESPPLSLCLMLEEARARNSEPASIALYIAAPAGETGAVPDLDSWRQRSGATFLPSRPLDWRNAPADAGVSLFRERRGWRASPATLRRLRPVAWIAGVALALHSVALVADWTRLAHEQRALRGQMESRFREVFPDAVAVVDPALQMRRKLVEAHHAVGQPDPGDFPAMIEKVARGLSELPPGALLVISYESGRMTLTLAVTDDALVRRIAARLAQAGLKVVTVPSTIRAGRDRITMNVSAT